MTTTHPDVYDPFAAAEFIRVTSVDGVQTPVLTVTFSDGVTRRIDLSEPIQRNRWFRGLAVQATFETVEIIEGGRGLQWVTGVDYCADALRILADKQHHGIA